MLRFRWPAGARRQPQRALFSTARQAAEMESQVLERMRSIQDGLGLGDIVTLGRVKVCCGSMGNPKH